MIQWWPPQVVTAPFPERMKPLPACSNVSPLIRMYPIPFTTGLNRNCRVVTSIRTLFGFLRSERVEVQLPVFPIDPEGAADSVQLIDPGQLGQSPPVLEHHGSR